MVFSIDKENKTKDKNILDLVYDIESFIVDLTYEDGGESPERQAYLGKLKLAKQAYAENERKLLYTRLLPIMKELGIREEIKGFRLLLELVKENLSCLQNNETFLLCDGYQTVSAEYRITPKCCERLCRYACASITFDKDFAKKYPGLSPLTHRTYEKVTVKELVNTLAEYVFVKYKPKNRNKII